MTILLAIAQESNDQGSAYVTGQKLADIARMSKANAFRAINKLRAERWIVTDRVVGQGRTLLFQINTAKVHRSRPWEESD